MPHQQKHSGFSLLELILVVVLLGVLASGAGLLISTPIEAYNDQLRRQQLVDQAEMALRLIARDVRRALPNSLRVSGDALEMINTVDGARYRDEVGGAQILANDWLDFTIADSQFNILGQFHVLTDGNYPNYQLVIYNTAASTVYDDLANSNDPGIATPDGTSIGVALDGDEHKVTLSTAFQFTQQSPGQRAFIVDGPISYICDTGARTLMRYSGYVYTVPQPVVAPATGVSGPVVTQLSACSINYDQGTAQRAGMVTLAITVDDVE
ncbi:MAG: prepilin-type N-terminal cleavage/methylation domain-containing protein, partial [Aestuariibacter sp.]|nr:prepilin-type N-terminal cleavage/methylation domain-containing protein [Aestuariibacter sp.]